MLKFLIVFLNCWVAVASEICATEDTVNYYACDFKIYQTVATKYVASKLFGLSERICLLEAGKFQATSVVYCKESHFCGIDLMPEFIQPMMNSTEDVGITNACKVYSFTSDACE